uniref:F-box protein 41 n=1 Tax=Maylandia zebra TaxID=106582 RepID=A0A3P9DRP9_9CICH
MSSSSSSSSSMELPYFCPRCGDGFRFSSVAELRAHLVSRHTYETLLVLSQVTNSRTSSLLPLPSPAVSQSQSTSLDMEHQSLPLPLACLDLASSSASVQLLREMFSASDCPLPSSTVHSEGPSTALALPGSVDLFAGKNLGEVRVQLGLVEIGLEERLGLGLDHKIARTFAELQRREMELQRARRDKERLRSEKQEVEEKAAYLSRQVGGALSNKLKKDLTGKEKELSKRQQSVSGRLMFIETLLERADCAERRLLMLGSHEHRNLFPDSDGYAYTEPYLLTEVYEPTRSQGGRSLDGSTDDIIANKMQETIGNRETHLCQDTHTWIRYIISAHHSCGLSFPLWLLQAALMQNFLWLLHNKSFCLSLLCSPDPDTPSSIRSTPSRCFGDRQLVADTLRLRAGLFCIFPYLDVRSMLRAAEVCSDWRFVARHPAVWTRLQLENARVSTEFLTTLSQWCTQTQAVVLSNLKPRSRRANETREDYHRNIRGSVEPGVEALLRSAGGSLLHLSISQCPHILTDRTLWLASCYSRNLQMLTYRSSSDPLGQEVLWALGAGCRSITSLQVAPAHPCQQPTRFGNRCLQTIGRCWPHLRSLSVGGAGCGTQGLVAAVRNCAQLQVLELERITDLGLQAATELCKAGLKKNLQTLILTHTPVSGQAILHFHSECENIRSIIVEVSASDYFEEPDTEEAQHLFGEILSTLKVLQTRPGVSDVLQVKADSFS